MIPRAVTRHVPRQPQVLAFAIVLPLASALSWWLCRSRLALLAGFDAAALVHLVWIMGALSPASPKHLRSRVEHYDTGQRSRLLPRKRDPIPLPGRYHTFTVSHRRETQDRT